MSNMGQKKLIETGLSLAQISLQSGVSRPTVSRWKRGIATPKLEQRIALESLFEISPDSWDEPLQAGMVIPDDVHVSKGRRANHKPHSYRQPGSPSKPIEEVPPPTDPRSHADTAGTPYQQPEIPSYPSMPEDGSTLDMIRHSLKCIQHDLQYRVYTLAGRSKVRSDETRTLALIAKLEVVEELKEPRYVHEHPEWMRLKGCILKALEAHPDAAKDVLEAMQMEYVF